MLEKVFNDLVNFEGLSLKVYRCPTGKLTIGYGRNLEDNGISTTEAELLLLFDIVKLISQLDRKVDFWLVQPVNVRIVILQMAFQLGVGGLLGFRKFLAALKENDYELAKKEMFDSKWAQQTPNRVKKLSEYLDYPFQNNDLEQWKKDFNMIQGFTEFMENITLFD